MKNSGDSVAASFDYGKARDVGDGQAWRDEACDRLQRMLDAQDRDEEIEDPDIFISPAIREMFYDWMQRWRETLVRVRSLLVSVYIVT